MTLPSDLPQELEEILADCRHGSIDRHEAKRRVEALSKSQPSLKHTGLLIQLFDCDDSAEWIGIS